MASATTSNVIQVPPASTGLKVDTAEQTIGANTVERQIVTLGDPNANQTATVGAQGGLGVSYVDGFKATYAAVNLAFNPGTSATTDIWNIYGSATKTIRVLRVIISATTSTAAVYYDYILSKRSTAFSGGTPVAATVVPVDSASAAGTATVNAFTAGPTAGTTVGSVASAKYFSPITGTPASFGQDTLVFDFGNHPGQAVVLRGVAQGLALTINAVTPTNASNHTVTVIWTEE